MDGPKYYYKMPAVPSLTIFHSLTHDPSPKEDVPLLLSIIIVIKSI